MKANKKNQRYMTHMEKGGRISWPVGLTNWKIGQRIFFSIIDGKVLLTIKPSGLFKGRLLSARVAKKFSSGPMQGQITRYKSRPTLI